jgi:S1-C subfamily serine protease
MNIKIKIISLIIFTSFITGCALQSKADNVVNTQQQEIQKLNKKIDIISGQLTSSSKQIKEIETKQKEIPQKVVVEKPIYIEKKEIIKIQTSTQDSSKESENIVITASELSPYLTGVARLDCYEDASKMDYSKVIVGSGSLWNIKGVGYTVLTNQHVISSIIPSDTSYCVMMVPDANGIKADKNAKEFAGFWWVDMKSVMNWNKKTDVALLKITHDFILGDPPTGLNYDIGALSLCDKRMSLNSPIVAIGFPASTHKQTSEGIYAFRTVTNGIISAHDESVITKDGLPAPNYFVSAKIDSGNSGGIALSKDKNGLCVLGIPTWVNVGNYEVAGVIQNIHNVFYSN